MTKRSMPASFHANLFALVPVRCPFSARDVSAVGAKGSGYFAPKGEVAVE